jgi:hypothetical protein
MQMNSFWNGFEKRAYDYKYEAKQLNRDYGARSKEKPISKSKSSIVGAALGASLGGLFGLSRGSAGLGALAGAALGGLTGLMGAISHKVGIEEAKRIMKMDPKKRDEYLRSLARRNEITEAESREWRREFHKELRDDARHRETLSALRNRY